MFKAIKLVKKKSGGNRKDKRFLILCCDQCYIKFEIKFSNKKMKKDLHFCSKQCTYLSQSSGLLKLKRERLCFERHGVKNPSQRSDHKEKCKKTSLEKYGVEHVMHSEYFKNKLKQTNLEKYGVEYVLSLKETHEKRAKTMIEKHGTYEEAVRQLYEKQKEGMIKKHGVDNAGMLSKHREKIIKTSQEKYGFNSYTATDEYRKSRIKTCLERYNHPSFTGSKMWYETRDFEAEAVKRHQTMKKNGTYGKSKSEDRFYEYLCNIFKKNDVERQKLINGWSIDFYIKSIDSYIQFDGVYWHGLNRPLEEIKKSLNPRDKTILGTIERDRKREEWFKENNLTLIRVTDIEFKNNKNILDEKL